MENICTEHMLNRFMGNDKIEEALASKRFIKILCKEFRFYIFKGLRKDYIVVPCRFCTCDDFTINYLAKGKEKPCYHVVGFKIAEMSSKIVELKVDPGTLVKILEEVIYDEFSSTLRKLLKAYPP